MDDYDKNFSIGLHGNTVINPPMPEKVRKLNNNYHCRHRPDKYCDDCMEAILCKYDKAVRQNNLMKEFLLKQGYTKQVIIEIFK